MALIIGGWWGGIKLKNKPKVAAFTHSRLFTVAMDDLASGKLMRRYQSRPREKILAPPEGGGKTRRPPLFLLVSVALVPKFL